MRRIPLTRRGGKVTQREIENRVRKRIAESLKVKEGLLEDGSVSLIGRVAGLIIEAYRKNGKVLLFGNGGSAADAQHIAAELGGKYYLDRPPLAAFAMHTNTSLLTAIGNDYSFAQVFARQIEAAANPGDVAIAITTSGNSENILEAAKTARARQATTVGLTGASGGRLKRLVDYCLCVPSTDTPRIQEGHILIGHILCELVEAELFADSQPLRAAATRA
jgi:D-sedoheptulose 7-phosphate isomerase